jgi:hypothetical protein
MDLGAALTLSTYSVLFYWAAAGRLIAGPRDNQLAASMAGDAALEE